VTNEFAGTGHLPVTWGSVNRIRERRLELAQAHPAAFSIVALAQRLGVGESTVRRWEDGSRRPANRQARKLAKELGLTVEEVRAAAADDPDLAQNAVGE
jgi:ribosome-binding protein aMBF1 (putative translation factor)